MHQLIQTFNIQKNVPKVSVIARVKLLNPSFVFDSQFA